MELLKLYKIISSLKNFPHKLSVCGFPRTVYA